MFTSTSRCPQIFRLREVRCGTSLLVKSEFYFLFIPRASVLKFYLRHPGITIKRVRHDDSTSNLARHVKTCVPANTKEAQAMRTYAEGSTYNEVEHRVKMSLWVSRRHRPFVIVEDPELLDIFKSLNPACVTPKRNTVSRDMREIHEMTKESVIKFLAVRSCLIFHAQRLTFYIVHSRQNSCCRRWLDHSERHCIHWSSHSIRSRWQD